MTHHRQSRVQEMAERARETLAPAAGQAREKATPALQEARERLAPLVEEVRAQANQKVRPAAEQVASTARHKVVTGVVPPLTAAAAAATAASGPLREEAKKRGSATLAAMKGELEAPTEKSHKVRNLVVLLGLGGAVAWGYKWYTGRDADAAWQSSYEPTPASPETSAGTTSPPVGSETGVGTVPPTPTTPS
ncbi:MAG: apolipoprotein A1/A4/E family protein, partial [Actinomycetota bacterium]|nr:apolipoprotein A1/A4/E family protein [Actinomycetota bacterium]